MTQRTVAGLLGPGLAILCLATRAPWIAQDLEGLVVSVVPDDSFYYFEIALQWWAGNGVTFDGSTPATGFHPLWWVLVLPLFAGAAPGAVLPVQAVLALGALLAALTGGLLYAFSRTLGLRSWPSVLLAVALCLHPWYFRHSLSGLETMLTCALVAGCCLALTHYLATPNLRAATLTAALFALTILARSDAAVVLLPAGACALALRRPWHREVLVLAGLPAATIAFGLVLTWWSTGSPWQSSAAAVPWVARQNWLAAHPDAGALAFAVVGIKTAIGGVLRVLGWLGPATLALGFGGLALSGYALLRHRAHTTPTQRAAAAALLALCVGLALLHGVHGYFRWIIRDYYFAPWLVLVLGWGALGLVLAPGVVRRFTPRSATVAALLLLGFVAAEAVWRAPALHHQYAWQSEMLAVGRAAHNHLAPGEALGSFNSAIIAYVNANPVVNLDGVVNEAAARAIRARALAAYLDERSIRLLADSPVMWSDSRDYFATLGPYFYPEAQLPTLRVVETIDHPGVGFPASDYVQVIARRPPPASQ